MREWEIGAVENIHGALPYIRFAPILALVGVGLNRIGKHEGSLSLYFDGSVRAAIKTGNPRSRNGAVSDQVGTSHLNLKFVA